jgi:hypothetical protein
VTLAIRALTLVTQDDCHLGERAPELLDAFGLSVRELAVDSIEAEYQDWAAAVAEDARRLGPGSGRPPVGLAAGGN